MLKTTKEIIVMAERGLSIAEYDILNWYTVARDRHLSAFELVAGRKPKRFEIDEIFAISALASYNASPANQSRLVADWLLTGSLDGFLPNTELGLLSWIRTGKLASSKAECYRLAMMEGSESNEVVIDRHMLCGLSSTHAPLPYSGAPRGKNITYNTATRRVLQAARVLGVSGCQCQAAIWYARLADRGRLYGEEGLIDIEKHLYTYAKA